MRTYAVLIGFNNRGTVGEETVNVEAKNTAEAAEKAVRFIVEKYRIHRSTVGVLRFPVKV